MCSNQIKPYPLPIEIIRVITTAFDIKNSNKKLDDKALDIHANYLLANTLIDELILAPLQKIILPRTAKLISFNLVKNFQDYSKFIGQVSADGLSRTQVVTLLFDQSFNVFTHELLTVISKDVDLPNLVDVLTKGDSSVQQALKYIEKYEPGWQGFLRTITKEERDRISAWKRGSDLPSSQYIYLLQGFSKGPFPEFINWYRVRTPLIPV